MSQLCSVLTPFSQPLHTDPFNRPPLSKGLTPCIWITDINFMAVSCEYILNISLRIFLLWWFDWEWYWAINYSSRYSFAGATTHAAIYHDLWGWKRKKEREREMETHLLGIHKYIHFLWGVNGWPNIEWSHHGCHHGASYHWPSDAQSNFQEFCVCKVKHSISWDFCLQSWRANWLNAIAYHTNNLLHSAHIYTQTHTSLKYSDAQLKK